jgi:hypothetical protein
MDIVKSDADKSFIERLRRFRGMLPADFEFDREDANSRD